MFSQNSVEIKNITNNFSEENSQGKVILDFQIVFAQQLLNHLTYYFEDFRTNWITFNDTGLRLRFQLAD